MGHNMLFITGTNVERTSVKKFKREISHDRDIKKLIRIGLFSVKWIPFVGLGLVATLFILFIVPFIRGIKYNAELDVYTNILNWVQNALTFDLSPIPIAVTCILFAIILAGTIVEIIRYIIELKEKLPAFRKAIRVIFKLKPPKTPLELWDVLQASIMDAQLTTSAERLFDTDVSLIYGGIPYYELLLVDSVYLKWEGSNISYRRIKSHYRKFFRDFAKKTLRSEIDSKYFSNQPRLQVSNCVFGVLFLSEYLQSFIQSQKLCNNGKYLIDCNCIQNGVKDKYSNRYFRTNHKSEGVAYKAAMEVMGYSTNPTFFTFSKDSDFNVTLKVCNIDFIGIDKKEGSRNSRREVDQFCKRNEIIRIPIKKLISLPFDQKNSNDPLPPLVLNPKNRTIKFKDVLVLGGAEQNIVLSNLINKFKWRYDGTINANAQYYYLGFAENIFDSFGLENNLDQPNTAPGNIDFLVGTEGFVYGKLNGFIRSKIEQDESKNKAEVFRLDINGIHYYFVYGYHAVSTKIATLKYFVYNESTNKRIRNTFIPGKYNNRITYSLIYAPHPDFKGLCAFWDLQDPINSDKFALLEKLNNIDVVLAK